MEVKEEDQRIKTQETLDLEEEEEEEDRISLLPDHLIIDEILSRLDSTKYTIRTGALSKRWQHLWPLVSCLHFTDPGYKPIPDFYLFVDKTLAQCKLKNLNKFCVYTNYDTRFESHVNNWIHFATSNKLQQFHLELSQECYTEDEDQFVLQDKDDSFFINPHFTHLSLGYCNINPTGPIRWNNLTNLCISNGKLDEPLIANILSGSPLLDTLRLDYCYGYSWLDITSKSVKNLVFCGYAAQDDDFHEFDHIIEINAPYISSLRIIGSLWLWKILLRDASSLVKADLDYTKFGYEETTPKEGREEMLKRFILSLRHVKELRIEIGCYTAFSRLEAKGFIFPSNLKVVEVNYPVYDSDDSDSTELGDCSDNDSSVVYDTDSTELGDCSGNDPSRVDLQSIAATLGQVIAPQQVLMLDEDQDAEQVGDEGDPAAGREVGADDDRSGDDVGAEETDVGPEV